MPRKLPRILRALARLLRFSGGVLVLTLMGCFVAGGTFFATRQSATGDQLIPPEVVLEEPANHPDSEGAIELLFTVRHPTGVLADVVVQWSFDPQAFPDISELSDPQLRRQVLQDPDARFLRGIVTPRLRTLSEARCRVPSPGLPPDELILSGMRPPLSRIAFGLDAGRPPERGMAVELLSPGRGIEETVPVAAVLGPERVRLAAPLDTPPRQGQGARVRETLAHLLFDLPARPASTEPGPWSLAWDAPRDLGPLNSGKPVFVRVTAFSGTLAGPPATSSLAKTVQTDSVAFDASTVAMVGSPVAVAAGDLDSDGRVDLAVADRGGNRLVVLRQQGDGSFDPSPHATGAAPVDVLVVDLDRDGQLDVLTADFDAHQVSIFSGPFLATRTTRPTGNFGPIALAVGEIDEDDATDLVLVTAGEHPLDRLRSPCSEGRVLALFGNGTDATIAAPLDCPADVVLGDLDRNGILEIVSAEPRLQRLTIYSLAGTPLAVDTSGFSLAVALVDVDGSGTLDLVSVDASTPQLSVFLMDSGLAPSAPRPLVTGETPYSVATGDLNGDGWPDLVSSEQIGRISIFLGKGDGSFVDPPTLLAAGDQPREIIVVDLDDDGQPDLVTADLGARQLSIFLAKADPTFSAPATAPIGAQPVGLALADLTQDGLMDVVTADFISKQLSILPGQGEGTVAQVATVSVGTHPRAVAAGDTNGDGRLDLIVAGSENSSSEGTLSLFPSGGADVGFEGLAEYPLGAGSADLAVADFDGDGHLDVATADRGASQLSLLHGRADGSLAAGEPIMLADQPRSVVAGDVDNDGQLDLVAAGSVVSVVLNADGQRFDAPRTVSGSFTFAALADLDQDGILDLISASRDALSFSVALGRGDGDFEPPSTIATGVSPRSVLAQDLDGDGFVDLVVVDNLARRLSIHPGRGDGTFSSLAATNLTTGLRPQFAAAGDLDRDGNLDLISVDAGFDQLSVFLNTSTGRAPEILGFPRAPSAPTRGNEAGGDLFLAPGEHTIDTTRGLIDGQACGGFQGRVFHFREVAIEEGATVRVSGRDPLVVLATGTLAIAGTLDCSGRDARSPSLEGSQGAEGAPGGPGGAAGGDGGGAGPGSRRLRGNRGGGPGGGAGGINTAAGGGGGFGSAGAGAEGTRGGACYGNPQLHPLYGGSGGGGGGALDRGTRDQLDAHDQGGGGGGGGGGAVRLLAGHELRVHLSGSIRADGGRGGAASGGAPGGGGSGGTILLQAYGRLVVEGELTAVGGEGGAGAGLATGGAGRIGLEDGDGVLDGSGSVQPDPRIEELPR